MDGRAVHYGLPFVQQGAGWLVGTFWWTVDATGPGGVVWETTGNGTIRDSTSPPAPIRAGALVVAECWLRAVEPATLGRVGLGFTWIPQGGPTAWPSQLLSASSLTPEWVRLRARLRVSAPGAMRVRLTVRDDTADGRFQVSGARAWIAGAGLIY